MNRAPLDHILSVVLMVGLLWGGLVLYNRRGPLKVLGGFMLLILSINVLNTSQYWLNGFNWLSAQERQMFNRLEVMKNA